MTGKYPVYISTKFHIHITFFNIHERIKFLRDINFGVDLSTSQWKKNWKNLKVFRLPGSYTDLYLKNNTL